MPKSYMTKFQRFMLTKIARDLVIQSHMHATNISEMYEIIRDAAANEFTEDSPLGLDSFMLELFFNAQKCDLDPIAISAVTASHPKNKQHKNTIDDDIATEIAVARQVIASKHARPVI